MLEKLLRSGAEVKVLGVVLFEDNLHLREIARRAGVSPFEAKRELGILASLGVLIPERKGNMALFRKNPACPYFQELKGIYLKTEGVAAQLSSALRGAKGIKYAFIFGSFASGKEKAGSDIDLMAIGEISEADLSAAVFKVQKTIGREINFILWTGKDLLEHAYKGSPFLNSLLDKKRLWLAGKEDEFVGIAEIGGRKEG